MALVPFKGRRKAAGYHGASGPNSSGRMPKSMKTGAQKTNESGTGNVRSAPSVEDVTSRRVQAVDATPGATSDSS